MADDDVPPLEDMTQVLEKFIKHVKARPVESNKSYNSDLMEKEDNCISSSTSKPVIKEVAKPEKSSGSFGGMKKGFLFGGQPKNSKSVSEKPNEIPFITKKKDYAKDSQLQFAEVQLAMKVNEALKQNQDELLKNIEKKEKLSKQILDPSFMQVISEFQTNPEAAVKQYNDNVEIQSFFSDFCSVIGDHFTTLGDQQPTSAPLAGGNEVKCHCDIDTDITEVSTRKFKELPDSEEDARVKEILENPEIKSILLDPRIRQLMDMLRNDPQSAERLLRTSDPELHSYIRKLVQASLLQIHY